MKRKSFLVVTWLLLISLSLHYCPEVLVNISAESEVVSGILKNQNGYKDYLEKYYDAPRPEVSLAIPASKFKNSDGAQVEIMNMEENAPILEWSNEAGWVEWSVVIPSDGLYTVALEYLPLSEKGFPIEMEFEIDGTVPFVGASDLSFSCMFTDDGDIQSDNQGNDLLPSQIVKKMWMTQNLLDPSGMSGDAYQFYFEQGEHTIRFTLVSGFLALKQILIYNPPSPESYLEYHEKNLALHTQNEEVIDSIIIEAEKPHRKTSNMLAALADRSDSMMSPADPVVKKLNSVGGDNWSSVNQTIIWKFEVEKDGYYQLGFRYKQNFQRGFYTARRVEIDGQLLFEELEDIHFTYGPGWQLKVAGDDRPYKIFLEKGEHEIALTPTLKSVSALFLDIDSCVFSLNQLYRKIVMITSTQPDSFRDYALAETVPELNETLQSNAEILQSVYDRFEGLTNSSGSEASLLTTIIYQLNGFLSEPDTIPKRLENFRSNISSLAAWNLERNGQQLQLDTIMLVPSGQDFPKTTANFFQQLAFGIQAFLGSFLNDYSSVGSVHSSEESVYVWASTGRDQAEILKKKIEDTFTPQTGITVNLALVQNSLVQAVLAGKGPDVVLMVGRGDPLNLAARNAIEPLDTYSGFEELKESFMPTAMEPYFFSGRFYAIPETQNFFMMFYRTDIFDELNLSPPNTWEDLYVVSDTLQRKNMQVGLPYTSLDAYSVVSQGMGTQSVFPALLLQNGGNYYNDEQTKTALDSPTAIQAFKQWTDFYKQYGYPLYKDDFSQFRTGEMPICIQYYTFYNQLYTAAPEIRGMWEMTLIPGTAKQDGNIDRTAAASGTASIMLRSAKNKNASWEFIRWWCSADTQGNYGRELEAVLGTAGRYNPASLGAIQEIPWSNKDLKKIMSQWTLVVEIPEVLGGYYTSRNIDNAFKAVIYDNDNYREALNYWNRKTNEEIGRKRKEFGLE